MASTLANVQAYLKTTFGPPIDVLPEENTLCNDIKFIPQDKRPGDKYVFPVRLQHEHGFTYNSDHSAFTLLTAKDSNVKRAELEGAEIAGVANVSYGIAAKMGTGTAENSRSYKQAVADVIEGLMLGGEIRRELSILYGSGSSGLANLGVVNSVISAVTTTLVVTITRASYAPGLWPQLIGAGFDFHTSGGTSHTSNAEMVLTAVNPSNTRLTFTGNATDVAAVLAADVITFRGSRAVSCVGLQAIFENTGSLFNIDAAVFPQWRANTYAVSGPFTFDKLQEGLATPHENGLTDGIKVYLGARAWTDLMTDEAALRRHVGADAAGKAKAGYSKIEFDSICGKCELITHRYFKQSLAMGIPTQYAARVGAQDLSFSVPGNKNTWFWRELDAQAGSQMRVYGDQAVILEKPNHAIMWTSIASSADVLPS